MNVTTIDVPVWKARDAARSYFRAIRSKHGTAHDEVLAKSYRAIARGKRLMILPAAIVAGGFHPSGLPKLAAIRADADGCHATRHRWHFEFTDGKARRHGAARDRIITVRMDTPFDRVVTGFARLPIIPPELRPEDALEHYVILWEADWQRAPADPLLLRHVAGDFYAIVAQWDLTELEQAVMNGPR